MNRLVMLLFACFVGLYSVVALATDWTPVIATEAALLTLEKPAAPTPAPKPKPKPDANGAGVPAGSPLDTYRDAKALIDKGNALADRGKAILDRAERDGKITLDIHIPRPSGGIQAEIPKPICSRCTGGFCSEPNDTDRAWQPHESIQPCGGVLRRPLFLRRGR